MQTCEGRFPIILSVVSFLVLILLWWWVILNAPIDAQQGRVYKIIFIHVPAAACALGLCGLGLLMSSIRALARTTEEGLIDVQAWVETGLVFTILTLLTGSIWGRPTWGTWWTWDARLTTTLLLAVLFGGFLLLKRSLNPGKQRVRICAIAGIMIFADIPLIYKSVEWWRTLHQPASLIAERGRTMDPEMLRYLLIALVVMLIHGVGIFLWRRSNLLLRQRLEENLTF